MSENRLIIDGSRLAGCLVGQCYGDAAGFPVEGQRPLDCRLHAARLRQGELPARRGFAPGQYSDDSQLARELVRSAARPGGFDPADYAARIRDLFTSNRIVGRGRATEQAAMRLALGVPWQEAGTPTPSAGNGSAMRAGPVGLLCGGDPERLVTMAVDQGRITHTDPRCSAGAVAIAGAVWLAARPGPIDVAAFSDELAHLLEGVDAGFAAHLALLPGLVAEPPDVAARRVATLGRAPGYPDGWPGISPFVVPSVCWSLLAFLRHPDDFLEAVITAVAVGGDVDTTGAMTGAIAGARAGIQTLPAPAVWVQDQGEWGYEALVSLALDAAGPTR